MHKRLARRRPAPPADEPMMDINTTPLIDVMLVLLIMLIITIPVQLDSVKLHLPTGHPLPPRRPPAVLRIDVDADSVVRWNGEALSAPGELEQRLQLLARQPEPPDLQLRPDGRAGYAVVAHMLATAQRVGLTRVGIAGSEQFAP